MAHISLKWIAVVLCSALAGCGKTESLSDSGLRSAKTKGGATVSQDGTKPGNQEVIDESKSADPPQSIAGLYLTCGDFVPRADDTNQGQSIGCKVTNGAGQRVEMQRFPSRRWVVKDGTGQEIQPTINELSNDSRADVRAFVPQNTGMPTDVAAMEFVFDFNKPTEKISYTFASLRNMSLTGSWQVTRYAQPLFGVSNAVLNAGSIKLVASATDPQSFTAIIDGAKPFTLDGGLSAGVGAQIFSCNMTSANDANLVLNKSQRVIPTNLNPAPILRVTARAADGSPTALEVAVNQSFPYNKTTWKFQKN